MIITRLWVDIIIVWFLCEVTRIRVDKRNKLPVEWLYPNMGITRKEVYNMNCTFFGHRDTPAQIKPQLRQVIIDLIEHHGVTQFYVGSQGNFDVMAHSLLSELEQIYPIHYAVVLAYLPKENDPSLDGSHTILPDGFETVPPRFAIDYRNRWMLDRSDVVVTYVRYPGGAGKYKALAERKGKTVVEISDV